MTEKIAISNKNQFNKVLLKYEMLKQTTIKYD